MTTITDVVSSHLEFVDRNVQRFYDVSTQIASLFQGITAQKISRYLGRLPYMQFTGGAMAKVSMNDANFPTGTGMRMAHLTFGFFYSMRAYRLTEEVMDLSEGSDQAVLNAASEVVSNIMADVMVDEENTLHGSGDGTYTNPCSSPVAGGAGTNTNTFIFASATDFLRLGKLRPGLAVDVWNQTLTTKRARADANTQLFITSVDPTTHTVVLNQNVLGACPAGSQDVFTVQDLDTYGPATLTSGAAAWPQTGVAAGLGGDSWRHGIYYANESSTALSYLGRSRASNPELIASQIVAGGAPLDWTHGRQGLDAVMYRSSAEQTNKLIGIANMAQIARMEALTINMAGLQLGVGDKGPNVPVDLAAFERRYGKPVYYAGIPWYPSKRQPRNRLDTVCLQDWFRAIAKEGHFVPGGDGPKPNMWRAIGPTGKRRTAVEIYWRAGHDYVCRNPQGAFYVTGLAAAPGYPY